MKYDYAIIGAGIVGLATAFKLSRDNPDAKIIVLEKEAAVARHQSSHNSGVIHAGVYYPEGSLKARFCRQGVAATLDFCARYEVPARQCGKLIVAADSTEIERLDALAVQAARNGLTIERLGADEIKEREPNITGAGAIHVHETGIADYAAMCRRLQAELQATGAEFSFSSKIKKIESHRGEITVVSAAQEIHTRNLIACAGLQADRIARMAGIEHNYVIAPFRGDFYRLPKGRESLVSTLIYPVPDPSLPFLGVHLTLTVDDGLVLGPSAMLALAREQYRRTGFSAADTTAMLTHPGLIRLLSRYPRAGLKELGYAVNKRSYLRAAQRYCPELRLTDLATTHCGIRAQLVDRHGALVNDFVLEQRPNMLHVLNAPSPAATAAFPIAGEICRQ